MDAMQIEATTHQSTQEAQPAMDLHEFMLRMKVELARLDACLARAEVRRLEERLAWERAFRRRGLLGRLF